MPPSFLPCKSPCPKTPPVTRPTVPREQEAGSCAAMRCVCDARECVRACVYAAFPPFFPAVLYTMVQGVHHAVPLTPAGEQQPALRDQPIYSSIYLLSDMHTTPHTYTHTQPVMVHKACTPVKRQHHRRRRGCFPRSKHHVSFTPPRGHLHPKWRFCWLARFS